MNFKRHFIALGLAFAVLLACARLLPGHALQLGSFALYGALHALCVVVALKRAPSLARRVLCVVLAALADAAIRCLGVLAAGSLAYRLAAGPLYVALGLCALCGAILYGLLLRALLLPTLRVRSILPIAIGCLAASVLVRAALPVPAPAQMVGIVAAWWLAFSSGLWFQHGRFHALGPQPDA